MWQNGLNFDTYRYDRLKRLTAKDIIDFIIRHKEVEDLEQRIEAIEQRFNEGR